MPKTPVDKPAKKPAKKAAKKVLRPPALKRAALKRAKHPAKAVRAWLSEIGKAGGRIGGLKRAAMLSPERRSEIASLAGRARAAKALKAGKNPKAA